MKSLRHSVYAFFLLVYVFKSSGHAAYHYCINSNTKILRMRLDQPGKETFMTNIRNHNKYLASQQCRWELQMRDMCGPRQLLLQPRMQLMPERAHSETQKNHLRCSTTLSVQLTGSRFQTTWRGDQIVPNIPLVVPVTDRTQVLTVKFNAGGEEPSADCLRQELSVEPVVKGYCGRSMLLHRSRCHLVSDSANGTADLNGSKLRLAGFSSIHEIRQLLESNNLRADRHPYKQPLNLSSPLRIGVFRSSESEQAFYFVSENGSSCKPAPFNMTGVTVTNISSTANSHQSLQCASLRVDASGDMAFHFIDCNQPMSSLLSFQETPDIFDRCEGRSWKNGDVTASSVVQPSIVYNASATTVFSPKEVENITLQLSYFILVAVGVPIVIFLIVFYIFLRLKDDNYFIYFHRLKIIHDRFLAYK